MEAKNLAELSAALSYVQHTCRYESALDVFHADFTVDSDKHLLVDVVLGLCAPP